jgi:hypothetical protein
MLKTFLVVFSLIVVYVCGHAGILDPIPIGDPAEACNAANWAAAQSAKRQGAAICGLTEPPYSFGVGKACGGVAYQYTDPSTLIIVPDLEADAFEIKIYQALAHYDDNNYYKFSLYDAFGTETVDFGFPQTFLQKDVANADQDEVELTFDLGIINKDMKPSLGAYLIGLYFNASLGGGAEYLSCSAFIRRAENDVDICQNTYPGAEACCLGDTTTSQWCDDEGFPAPEFYCVQDYGSGFNLPAYNEYRTLETWNATQQYQTPEELCPEDPGFLLDCGPRPTIEEYCTSGGCSGPDTEECVVSNVTFEKQCNSDCLLCRDAAYCDNQPYLVYPDDPSGCSTFNQDRHDASVDETTGECKDDTPTETQGTDTAGTDTASTDKAGTDTAGTDKAGTDTAGTDKAGTDTAGTDKAGTDKAGTDKAGTDKGSEEDSGSNSTALVVSAFLLLCALFL